MNTLKAEVICALATVCAKNEPLAFRLQFATPMGMIAGTPVIKSESEEFSGWLSEFVSEIDSQHSESLVNNDGYILLKDAVLSPGLVTEHRLGNFAIFLDHIIGVKVEVVQAH